MIHSDPRNCWRWSHREWLGVTSLISLVVGAVCTGLGCDSRSAKAPDRQLAPGELVAVSPEQSREYAGDAACASCHPDEARAHRRSRHALTLKRAAPPETRSRAAGYRGTTDKETGTHYALVPTDSGVDLVANGPSGEEGLPLEWAIGSGRRGVSYLSRTAEGRYVVLRISYFASGGRRWGFTPGQEDRSAINHPLGRKMHPAAAAGCFLCHSSVVAAAKDGHPDLELTRPGVGCESCHGPGRKHAEGRSRGKPVAIHNPAHGSAEELSRLCGRCHRSEQENQAAQLVSAAEVPRSPAFALGLSRCFQESEGRLTCTTCHDPHGDARPAADSFYTRKCLSCHQPGQPNQTSCPVRPDRDCVSCHMPQEVAHGAAEHRFATHDIAIYRDRSRETRR